MRGNRIDVGGEVYHCMNRAVGKRQIFFYDRDYRLFEKTLEEAVELTHMRILAYCVMPNHFHFVLYPVNDGDLSLFMKYFTGTYTQRMRTMTHTVGEGAVFQSRYKSFIVQSNEYLFTVLRYVERNPYTADIVDNVLKWKYSSLYRRYNGTDKQKKILTPWMIDEPDNYLQIVMQDLTPDESTQIEISEAHAIPYGDDAYIIEVAEKFNLKSILKGKWSLKFKKDT